MISRRPELWLLAAACVEPAGTDPPGEPPPIRDGPTGYLPAPDLPSRACHIDEWSPMGVALNDIDGDGDLDLAMAECETLVVLELDGADVAARHELARPGNPATTVLFVDPARTGTPHLLWLGRARPEILALEPSGPPRPVPGAWGLSHSGDEHDAAAALHDLDADGDLDLLLGRTSAGEMPAWGDQRAAEFLGAELWRWTGDRFVRDPTFFTDPGGVWHFVVLPGTRDVLVLMDKDHELSEVVPDGERWRHTAVPVPPETSPMGGAARWVGDGWEVWTSGVAALLRLQRRQGLWFDAAAATGFGAALAPSVGWSVLPVDAEADGVEELLVLGGLFDAPFLERWQFGTPSSADHLLRLDPPSLDPAVRPEAPARDEMGGLVADVDGDHRPDVLARTYRLGGVEPAPGDPMPLTLHLAGAGAAWAELRFDQGCHAVGAVLTLGLDDREEQRLFQPYTQGVGYGSAPLDRTWVPVPTGDRVSVAIQFPRGAPWVGEAAAGQVTTVRCR